jgi:hypothetical protein
MVDGKIQGAAEAAIYVYDASNQEMLVMRWDRSRETLITLGHRDAAADAEQAQKGGALNMESSTASTKGTRLNPASGALWASAFVIGAMLTVQAGRLGAPGTPDEAYAGNIAEIGQVRLLTADAGGGEEFLAILDLTGETISVYGVENQRSIELYQVARLPELFEQARAGTGSKR